MVDAEQDFIILDFIGYKIKHYQLKDNRQSNSKSKNLSIFDKNKRIEKN